MYRRPTLRFSRDILSRGGEGGFLINGDLGFLHWIRPDTIIRAKSSPRNTFLPPFFEIQFGIFEPFTFCALFTRVIDTRRERILKPSLVWFPRAREYLLPRNTRLSRELDIYARQVEFSNYVKLCKICVIKYRGVNRSFGKFVKADSACELINIRFEFAFTRQTKNFEVRKGVWEIVGFLENNYPNKNSHRNFRDRYQPGIEWQTDRNFLSPPPHPLSRPFIQPVKLRWLTVS